MESREWKSLAQLLETLPAAALRFLCGMYKLPRGGSTHGLRARLLSSGYPASALLRSAAELRFGQIASEYVSKSVWAETLRSKNLPASGSRETLLLSLVENQLFDGTATLESMSPRQMRELYYRVFGRVPTRGTGETTEDILTHFELARNASAIKDESTSEPSYFEHDVALSFAGEDRQIADSIGTRLRSAGIEVFYDVFFRTHLWGKKLSDEFRLTYGSKTRFVVPLISKHYAVKDWTDFEFSIAREEAGRRTGEFILPVRLDRTKIPGLRSDIAYLDFRDLGVEGVVVSIIEKVNLHRAATSMSKASKGVQLDGSGVRLDFFFRRYNERLEWFAPLWKGPEALHQADLNAEIWVEGGKPLPGARVTVIFDARLIPGLPKYDFPLRNLSTTIRGQPAQVFVATIDWKHPAGISPFKSPKSLLFPRDVPISFKEKWLYEGGEPFILWTAHASGGGTAIGSVVVGRDKKDVVLIRGPPIGREDFPPELVPGLSPVRRLLPASKAFGADERPFDAAEVEWRLDLITSAVEGPTTRGNLLMEIRNLLTFVPHDTIGDKDRKVLIRLFDILEHELGSPFRATVLDMLSVLASRGDESLRRSMAERFVRRIEEIYPSLGDKERVYAFNALTKLKQDEPGYIERLTHDAVDSWSREEFEQLHQKLDFYQLAPETRKRLKEYLWRRRSQAENASDEDRLGRIDKILALMR